MRIKGSGTLLYLSLILLSHGLFSQNKDPLREGARLHSEYRFAEAIQAYKRAAATVQDSATKVALQEGIVQCENGKNLMSYTTSPKLVSHASYSVEDFYLHISSLQDKSWIKNPNVMVSTDSHPYYNAVYFPSGLKTVYYSAPDNTGSWNIYQITQLSDTLWAEPKLAGENIRSSGDEIFPMVSSDGKELYFASNGHYGMGGYDLYLSRWDDESQEWGVPENLGFPYSSVEDDVFFINSPDGQYSIVATTRAASAQRQISLYALEFTPTPIKREISDVKQMQRLALFSNQDVPIPAKEEIGEIPKDEGMSEYAKLVQQMRLLSKELEKNILEQNENRKLYETIENEDDKAFIEAIIGELESASIEIKQKLDEATFRVQKAELDFLSQGIIPKHQIDEAEDGKKSTETTSSLPPYHFSNYTYRGGVDMMIHTPIPQFDYTFKVGKEAQFAEDNRLPEGLIYQIQLMVVSNKADKKSLKGLSPIYEIKQPTGKYLYSVGVWKTHSEALSCLNQVKKAGFPKAYIIAYLNGKSISVKSAKLEEKKIASSTPETRYQVVLSGYGESLPEHVITAIREASDKDIAKSIDGGHTLFLVGPYTTRDEAQRLKTLLEGIGMDTITIQQIKK